MNFKEYNAYLVKEEDASRVKEEGLEKLGREVSGQ